MEDQEFILTDAKLRRFKSLNKSEKRDSTVCASCKLSFKVGDLVLKCSMRYIHKSCLGRYRFDVTEEPSEEELANFFT